MLDISYYSIQTTSRVQLVCNTGASQANLPCRESTAAVYRYHSLSLRNSLVARNERALLARDRPEYGDRETGDLRRGGVYNL